jgi:CRISPR system Cascade subunit CasE
MYLSCLLIDTGDNPDRPRPGRLWLRNLYHVHQRLCMAFPSALRKKGDPEFLAPYAPDDFPEQRYLADKKKTEVDPEVLKQVHSRRSPEAGFLFRIDPQPGGRALIVVQSAAEPNWDYAFHNARYLLAAPHELKPFEPCFTNGQRLRFRLAANPTRRLSEHSLERDGRPVEEKWIGKRVPVPHDQLLDWLAEWRFRQDGQDEPSGFCIDRDRTMVQPGYMYFKKPKEGRQSRCQDHTDIKGDGVGRSLFSARYEGILEVTEPDKFCNTLLRGVGPGKAFGFGLLSVAPCRTPAVADAL